MANYRFHTRNRKLAENRELDHAQRFLIASVYRFMQNFLARHQGHLHDDDFFAPVADRMGAASLRQLLSASAAPVLRRTLLGLKKGERADLAAVDAKELMFKLWEHPGSNRKFRLALSGYLETELAMLQASLARDPALESKRWEELRVFFKLSAAEEDLLLLRRLAEGFWSCDDWQGNLSYGKFDRIASALGVTDAELGCMTKPEARLRKLACLGGDLDFNRDLLAYLCGADDTPLELNFYTEYKGELLPWKFFGELAEKPGRVLAAMLADTRRTVGLHILFYGAPGTGKTSFANALAAKLGRRAYLIKQNCRNRFSAIQVCELQRDKDSALIIIDEADKLLDCAEMNFFGLRQTNGDKGELNSVLDSVKTPCIWIANTPAGALDQSSRRRFDYSIEFKPLTADNRERIWRNAAQKHGVALADGEISSLAARYSVSAGGIELALRNFAALEGQDSEEKISKILVPHCALMQSPVAGAPEVAREYILDGLNIKGDLEPAQIVDAVGNFLSQQSTDPDRPRMNLLLSGPPGTGKTEFVKYLGKALAVPVVTKTGSDILSMWLGGTEKNIAAAFAEAQNAGAILFFDEIDGLMQSRQNARRSWEVTQVNELLQQMENFSGVMIGATNFARSLDPATARRFTFKLEFDFLDECGKRLFFERMFRASLSMVELERLAAIPDLAPGDFRTARQSLFYLDRAADNAQRLAALEREAAAKKPNGRPLGF